MKNFYKYGKNAKDNLELLKNADVNDWWIHLENDSSSHIIIEKDTITDNDLQHVCKEIYNKKKNNPRNFIYTKIKNLKWNKKPGEVQIKDKNKIKYYFLKEI